MYICDVLTHVQTQTTEANVKMLSVAKNIDFREKKPIDLFYRVGHKETFGLIGWSKLSTV